VLSTLHGRKRQIVAKPLKKEEQLFKKFITGQVLKTPKFPFNDPNL